MWFHDSMNEVYDNAIRPAVEDAGYEPVRIDREEHLDQIDDAIIAALRRARFVVADFTHGDDGARGGVYYEAGFAHGLNIPVIFSCRRDAIREVHLDTRQYPHILWEMGRIRRIPQGADETHLRRHRRWAACQMNERSGAWLAR